MNPQLQSTQMNPDQAAASLAFATQLSQHLNTNEQPADTSEMPQNAPGQEKNQNMEGDTGMKEFEKKITSEIEGLRNEIRKSSNTDEIEQIRNELQQLLEEDGKEK